MREVMPLDLQGHRIFGLDTDHPTDWRHGAYEVLASTGETLRLISSHGYGWEHVSVSVRRKKPRVPNWSEMAWVRDLFWTDEESVFQFHPPKKDYVNFNEFVLHLWRHTDFVFPLPPKWMIAPYDGWEKDCPKELMT